MGKSRAKSKSSREFRMIRHELKGELSTEDRDESDSDQELLGLPWPGVSTQNLELLSRVESEVSGFRAKSLGTASGAFRPRVVIGEDDRKEVSNTKKEPYGWICSLRISVPQAPQGLKFIGTGWLVAPDVVVTAGHCVYNDPWEDNGRRFGSGSADAIEVYFGRRGDDLGRVFKAVAIDAADKWINGKNDEFDFGAIFLNKSVNDSGDHFEFAEFGTDDLERMLVNIAGFPGDKPGKNHPDSGKFMYEHVNRIVKAGQRQLEYIIDTYPGQSGSPVVFWDGEKNRVVGIHNRSSKALQRNYATRIQGDVFEQLEEWRDG
jgi:glutamyl endopeptidase